jgi:uncharacterized surface anchored protein
MIFRLLLCAVVSALVVQPVHAADDAATIRARALGVRVQDAIERHRSGSELSSIEFAELQHALDDENGHAAPGTAATLKLDAVNRAFGMLMFAKGRSVSVEQHPTPLMRSQFVSEIVGNDHGGRCSNALGFRPQQATDVSLVENQDAWFYIVPQAQEVIRIATRSNGPDPAIEIFDGCNSRAQRLAANDDAIGLDAAVIVGHTSTDPLYVHLINTGETGVVAIVASGAPGSINGAVRDGATNQPIQGAQIAAYGSTQGNYFNNGFASTDTAGNYALIPNEPGSYFIFAAATYYLPQLYPSGFCAYQVYYSISSCDFSHAAQVTVTATDVVSNINFALNDGVQLSGDVRASDNSPISNASVQLLSPTGYIYGQVGTDNVGHYKFTTLPPGSYLLEATAQGYGSQFYDLVTCTGPLQNNCDTSSASPVTVGTNDVVDVDFSLPRQSAFTGTVTDASGSTPPIQGYVGVLDSNGNLVASSYSDGAGHFTTNAVPIGTYFVYAGANGYFSQLYGGHDCGVDCSTEIAQGTSLSVTANGQFVVADFALDSLPALHGHITDAITGAPLNGVNVVVNTQPPSTNNYPYYSSYTTADGNYTVSAIPAGSYYVWAVSPNHLDQVYSGVPCEAPDYYYLQANCDVSGATLIEVAPQQAPPNADFALNPSSAIGGVALARAGTGSDLAATAVSITLYNGAGTVVAGTVVDASGKFLIPDLAPGTYYAVATSNNPYMNVFVGQQWKNKDCPNTCVATTGTPIPVASNVTVPNIDFQMTELDAVVGRVVDGRGLPIGGVVVDLFSTLDKSYIGGGSTDAQGFYAVHGTIGYSYYVATEAGGGYIDQVYAGISCPNGTAYDQKCSLSGATQVSVSAGATQPHIANFALISTDPIFRNGFD